MAATVIRGTELAARIRADVAEQVAALYAETGIRPGLATVLIGNDPASQLYVESKRRLSRAVGITDLHQHLPEDSRYEEVAAVLDNLATDPAVSGILLQLPVPPHLDVAALIEHIPREKDVDGLTSQSVGLLVHNKPGLQPCTPAGIIALLDAYGVVLDGATVVVVGRSNLVGKPLAHLLLQRNATVTITHSHTHQLGEVTRNADVVVVAAGVAGLIGAADIKPGATVIDVGINRSANGVRGDVDFSPVSRVAGLITPVPGGVGPMTLALLLSNTLSAARQQHLVLSDMQ